MTLGRAGACSGVMTRLQRAQESSISPLNCFGLRHGMSY